MIDIRKGIVKRLKTLCDNVTVSPPQDTLILPLITYSQVSDSPSGRMYNTLEYQIDVFENSFASAIELAERVDNLMAGDGWSKTYQSPDSSAYVGTDLYHIVLSYQATVNRKWMAIISSQKTQ